VGVLVYSLCAVTALGCACLLLLSYRKSRVRLLLWSGLCFALLAANNGLIIVDLVIFPDVDLFVVRNAVALAAILLLLYGLIWEAR